MDDVMEIRSKDTEIERERAPDGGTILIMNSQPSFRYLSIYFNNFFESRIRFTIQISL